MTGNKFSFTDVVAFAQFCAELQRQGIAFHGSQLGDAFHVILTGF